MSTSQPTSIIDIKIQWRIQKEIYTLLFIPNSKYTQILIVYTLNTLKYTIQREDKRKPNFSTRDVMFEIYFSKWESLESIGKAYEC